MYVRSALVASIAVLTISIPRLITVTAVVGLLVGVKAEPALAQNPTCAAGPVTATGPQLAAEIQRLEAAKERSMQQLRDLQRRGRLNQNEMERWGNLACNQKAELESRLITDSVSAGIGAFRNVLSRPATGVVLRMTEQTKPDVLRVLGAIRESQVARGATRAVADTDRLMDLVRNTQGAGADPELVRNIAEAIHIGWGDIVAAQPPVPACGPDDLMPQLSPSAKVFMTSLRTISGGILGKVHPAFALLDPVLDYDNWMSLLAYRVASDRIEQFSRLADLQKVEWQALTCNLQRDVLTLREARVQLAASPPLQTGGASAAKAIVITAGLTGGALLGAVAYSEYQKAKEEVAAVVPRSTPPPSSTPAPAPAPTTPTNTASTVTVGGFTCSTANATSNLRTCTGSINVRAGTLLGARQGTSIGALTAPSFFSATFVAPGQGGTTGTVNMRATLSPSLCTTQVSIGFSPAGSSTSFETVRVSIPVSCP